MHHLLRPHRRTPSSSTSSVQPQQPIPSELSQLPPIETSPPNFLGNDMTSILAGGLHDEWTEHINRVDSQPYATHVSGESGDGLLPAALPGSLRDKALPIGDSGKGENVQAFDQQTATRITPQVLHRRSTAGKKSASASSSSAFMNTGISIQPTTHKKHNAKSLLHPMSLLLRRRSAQATNVIHGDSSSSVHSSYHFVHNRFGPTRDLPEDFDPGIIYGTRQHDWSSPRNIQSLISTTVVNMPKSDQTVTTLNSTATKRNNKELDSGKSMAVKNHAPLFREHFGDDDSIILEQRSFNCTPMKSRNNKTGTTSMNLDSLPLALELRGEDSVNGNQSTVNNRHILPIPYSVGGPTSDFAGSFLDETTNHVGEEVDDLRGVTLVDDTCKTPIHLLENASRFSFEASSATESSNLDDYPLEELAVVRQLRRSSYNAESSKDTQGDLSYSDADSDDVDSLYLGEIANDSDDDDALFQPPEDIRNLFYCHNDDTSRQVYGNLSEAASPQSLGEPQPHEETLATYQLGLQDQDVEASSIYADSQSSLQSYNDTALAYPPFMNPVGAFVRSEPQKYQRFYAPDGSRLDDLGNTMNSNDMTHSLPFNNVYQTDQVGIPEHEEFTEHFSNTSGPFREFDDRQDFEAFGDEDDLGMIDEANREALAFDNDGWYLREFGSEFYEELPRPGFVGNNSLTPISERSESSFRNSLIVPSSISLAASQTGVGAISLSAALTAQLSHGGHSVEEAIPLSRPLSSLLSISQPESS